MTKNTLAKQPIALLRESFNIIINNPVILYPFFLVAFIQLLLLEVIFFAPRQPLSSFFGPVILKLQGELYLHYPYNFIILTKWFQSLQIPIYIIFNSFMIGMAVGIINLINSDRKVSLKTAFKETIPAYVHLFLASIISVGLMFGCSSLYGLAMRRALVIRSTHGIFYWIKRLVLDGAPYVNLLLAVGITTLFAFVIPLIIIERKKIFSALVLNFVNLWKSFWFIFAVVFLPGLLYVPVLLLKTNPRLFETFFLPEMWGLLIVLSVLVTLFIDAIQYTAITTYYLLKKESK